MAKKIIIHYERTGKKYEYPAGISLLEILNDLDVPNKKHIVSAVANYKSVSLDFELYKPKTIDFIGVESSSGTRVFIRSLSMILSKALKDLFPEAQLHIEHPLSKGYFCKIKKLNTELTSEIVLQIKERMIEIINQNLPIIRHEKSGEEAIELFRKRQEMDKVVLLETINQPYIEYYELDGYFDYYNSPLVPSTGYLKVFDLIPFYDGVLMRTPARSNPDELEELVPQPKMYEIFKEYIAWNEIMGISNVGDFNLAYKQKKAHNLIKIAEALHEKKIAGIADQIKHNIDQKRFILVSGPSSSGKTTFSKRLSIQLMAMGIQPLIISLDNYFVDREKTPLDKNGEYDFESLYALDIPFFNKQLKELLDGQEVVLPTFSFETGKRSFKGEKVTLGKNNIVLLEGIHALNPKLTPNIPDETKFTIYVSALTTISLDNHNWIPTTDNRLLRRIVRDFRYRGYTAQDTISRWQSVRHGEDKWIFPFQENADVMFNSALIFEIAVLKKYAEPILSDVPRNSKQFTEANRLLKFLRYFTPIYDREIPPTSLLREFLGGSSFRY